MPKATAHLEKLKGVRETEGAGQLLVRMGQSNASLQHASRHKDHLYASFMSKIAEIPELKEAFTEQKKLAWSDPRKSYEELRAACDKLLDEQRLERHRKQLDHLYETGATQNAIVASPEEKAKMPCFFVRDGKPCPNGKRCPYSHNPAVIEKAKQSQSRQEGQQGRRQGQRGEGQGRQRQRQGRNMPVLSTRQGGVSTARRADTFTKRRPSAAHVAAEEPAPKAKAKAGAAPKAGAAEEAKPKS